MHSDGNLMTSKDNEITTIAHNEAVVTVATPVKTGEDAMNTTAASEASNAQDGISTATLHPVVVQVEPTPLKTDAQVHVKAETQVSSTCDTDADVNRAHDHADVNDGPNSADSQNPHVRIKLEKRPRDEEPDQVRPSPNEMGSPKRAKPAEVQGACTSPKAASPTEDQDGHHSKQESKNETSKEDNNNSNSIVTSENQAEKQEETQTAVDENSKSNDNNPHNNQTHLEALPATHATPQPQLQQPSVKSESKKDSQEQEGESSSTNLAISSRAARHKRRATENKKELKKESKSRRKGSKGKRKKKEKPAGPKIPDAVTLSSLDRSPAIKLESDNLVAVGAKGYRMVRGTHGIKEGEAFFEVTIMDAVTPPPLIGSTASLPGPHCRIGWCTAKGDLECPVGFDRYSYGYRDVNGTKFHESEGTEYADSYGLGDTIGCWLRLVDDGSGQEEVGLTKEQLEFRTKEGLLKVYGSRLIFFKNGVSQSAAFKDITQGTYFPAVSLYMGAKVQVNFGPTFKHRPPDYAPGLPAGAQPPKSKSHKATKNSKKKRKRGTRHASKSTPAAVPTTAVVGAAVDAVGVATSSTPSSVEATDVAGEAQTTAPPVIAPPLPPPPPSPPKPAWQINPKHTEQAA